MENGYGPGKLLSLPAELVGNLSAVNRATELRCDLVYDHFNRITLRKRGAQLVGDAECNGLNQVAWLFHHISTDLVDDLIIDRQVQIVVEGRLIDVGFHVDIDEVIISTGTFVGVIPVMCVKRDAFKPDECHMERADALCVAGRAAAKLSKPCYLCPSFQ